MNREHNHLINRMLFLGDEKRLFFFRKLVKVAALDNLRRVMYFLFLPKHPEEQLWQLVHHRVHY